MIRTLAALATLVVLVLPATAQPFQHSSGEWRQYFRDWLASCPDAINEDATDFPGFSCFASTGSAELNGANLPAYKLTLIRNRLTGALDVAITIAGDDGDADPSRAMELQFAGEAPIRLRFGEDLETRYNTTNQFFLVDEALRTDVLERLRARNAVTLTIPLTGTVGSKTVRLSLRGVSASIDFMATYARRVAQY
jgi:hypothetical protein